MKTPKALLLIVGMAVSQIFACGCKTASTCSVTQYGPGFMTYRGSHTVFMDACRKVLHDLSSKEQLDSNRIRYPHYGEGGSSHKGNGRAIASEVYIKTQGEDGAQYKVTILTVGKREPLVQLQSTAQDPYKLVNALSAEFSQRKIKMTQYSP